MPGERGEKQSVDQELLRRSLDHVSEQNEREKSVIDVPGESVERRGAGDAFFELAEYPLMATIMQNQKYLLAQLARHGRSWLQAEDVAATWQRSDQAHDRIQELTQQYNALKGGKWQGIMSCNPRNLTVFQPLTHTQASAPLPAEPENIASFYGASYHGASFSGKSVLDPVLGLGASIRAMPLPKGCDLTYRFSHRFVGDQANLVLHMLPTHPIEEQQRITVSLDGGLPVTLTYATEGRSEQWKQNVLRGFAVVTCQVPVGSATDHTIRVTALDDGVVLDELFVRP